MKKTLLLFALSIITLWLNAQNIVTVKEPQVSSNKSGHAVAHTLLTQGQAPATLLNIVPTFDEEGVCGLNYVYGSVMTETRSIAKGENTNGTGFPATITISGLPSSCMAIQQAYLYYDASYTENAAPTTSVTLTNPAAIVGTYTTATIGTGPEKCWGEKGTASYRTDVTAAISGNGTYTINLNGFANAAKEVDGCTLIIAYVAGPANGSLGTLIFFDGISVDNSSGNSTSYSVNGFDACAASTTAQSFFLIADQTDVASSYTSNVETLDGTNFTFPNNQWNFNVANTPFTAGQTTTGAFSPYINDVSAGGFDCYNAIMYGFYFQTSGGACATCIPVVITPTTGSGTLTEPSCNGQSNGSITANVSGGTSPYTYTWTPPVSTGKTATGLSAGTYTISVEDAICGTSTLIVVLTQPNALIGSRDSTGVLCYGGNTGIAGINPSGGTSPYTYLWSNGETTATATGLSAGTYTVTMQDKHGCSETVSVVVTQPSAVTSAPTTNTGVSCNGGNNGTITLTTNGGTSPYTYTWSPIGGTTATATGLSAGTYTITIKDANGCTPTSAITVVVTQPAVVKASTIINTSVSCNGGNNGSSTASASGGTSPYTYSWSPTGGNNSTANGLSAGTYTVTATDNHGCTATATVTIAQPTLLSASTTMTQATCGGTDGTATATVTGGTSPYTYSWAPIGGNNSTATGLSAGTYTATVTDKNSCMAISIITVTNTGGPAVTITTSTNVNCNSGNNGSATVTVTGGVKPYTYSWSPSGGTNITANGLIAGIYTITVKDANGCISAANVTITQPSAISSTTSVIKTVSCNGYNNGSATVNTVGGVSPYTYSWSPVGGNAATATGLTAGTYTITVTDNHGCVQTAVSIVVVTQPAIVTGNISASTNVSCNGGNNGSATVGASGGTSPYTYAWTPSGGNNATANGLTAGNYTVTITDKNGCTSTTTYTVSITQPPLLTSTIVSTMYPSCNGQPGTATVNAGGGTVPYTYSWSPTGGNNTTGTGLIAGNYTVTVTDKNGCTSTAKVSITQPPAIISTKSSSIGITCNGDANGSVTLSTTGGVSPYTYSWSPSGGNNVTGTGLSAGIYTVTVTDADGCTNNTTTVIVTQPALLTPIITVNSQVKCNGDKNGSVTVNSTGGTLPYTYSWTPTGSNNTNLTGLSAGTYTVMVTDKNGCTGTAKVTITQPNVISVSISSSPQDSACIGQNLTLRATGANTYLWSNGGTNSATLVVVPSGTSVTYWVKGYVGNCYDSVSITLKIIQPITATMKAGNDTIVCPGGATTMTAIGSGGSLSYLWSNGATTSSITVHDTVTTTYTVVVSGPCNSVSLIQKVTVIPLPKLTFTGSNWVCAGGSETITVSSATNPTTYLWSNGNTSTSYSTGIINKDTNIYVIATNSLGCSITDTFKITDRLYPTDTIHYPRPACANDAFEVNADIISGVGPFTYLWNTGATTDSISVSISGTTSYTVIVSNGCPVTQTVTIDPHTVILSACCDNKILLGQDTVLVAKGKNIVSCSWAPSSYTCLDKICDSVLVTPTTTTTYTVTGVDATGCPTEVPVTIRVEIPCLKITIPNVFTPTYAGTLGLDNKFYIQTENIDTWSLAIYDRWGVEIFKSTNPNDYWTGNTENGSVAPAGVYYYVITGNCQSYTYNKDGYIQLIR